MDGTKKRVNTEVSNKPTGRDANFLQASHAIRGSASIPLLVSCVCVPSMTPTTLCLLLNIAHTLQRPYNPNLNRDNPSLNLNPNPNPGADVGRRTRVR